MKKTNYENIAKSYDETESRHYSIKDPIISELVKNKEGLRILDLGCGTGNYLKQQQKFYNENRVQWYGVDPSPKMLQVAKSKLKDVQLFESTAESLNFKHNYFDYVICNHSYHHFMDKEEGFQKVFNVLKSNGIYHINSIYPFKMRESWIYKYFKNSYEEDVKRFLKLDQLSELLSKIGFDHKSYFEEQIFSISFEKAIQEAQVKNYSQLHLVSPESFNMGLKRLQEYHKQGYSELETEFCKMYTTARKPGTNQ